MVIETLLTWKISTHSARSSSTMTFSGNDSSRSLRVRSALSSTCKATIARHRELLKTRWGTMVRRRQITTQIWSLNNVPNARIQMDPGSSMEVAKAPSRPDFRSISTMLNPWSRPFQRNQVRETCGRISLTLPSNFLKRSLNFWMRKTKPMLLSIPWLC